MSFFANIIADSRRKIKPTQRVTPVIRPFSNETKTSGSSESEVVEANNKTLSVASHDVTSAASPTTTSAKRTLSQATANQHTDIAFHSVNNNKPILEKIRSTPVVDKNANQLPLSAVQLKLNNRDRSNLVLAESIDRHSKNSDATTVEEPQSRPTKKKLIKHKQQTLITKQDVHVYDAAESVPSHIVDIPSEVVTSQEMKLGGIKTDGEHKTQSKPDADGQIAKAAYVMAEIQSEPTVSLPKQDSAPTEFVRNHPYVDANNKPQSRIQIGQVNVVIEQPAIPRQQAKSVTSNNDYVSRNFLKTM
ncbi:MAG: hypothetical protein OEX11_03815 [Nitrosomonas sp.]|nr:hypothetical protein [Nitrosomonas sp.]